MREASAYRVFQPSVEGSIEGMSPRLIPIYKVRTKPYKHEHGHYLPYRQNIPWGVFV